MRWLVVVLALAGCDKVLGLSPNPILDAPVTLDHDEDDDNVGDTDDNCPTVKGSQADADTDGVGDLCDPDPNAANQIRAFYGFDVMPGGWIAMSGSWAVANDALVHKGDGSFSKLVARNLSLTPPYVIEARFRFDTAPDGGEFSVTSALDLTAQGSFCTIVNATETEVHAYNDFSPGTSGVTRVEPLDFTATFTARMIVEPTSVTCIMRSDKQGDTAATGTAPSIPVGPMGFEGRYADTTTEYVIVYTR